MLVVAVVLAATYQVVNRPPSASLESSAFRWKKSLRAADVWPVILPNQNCFMPVAGCWKTGQERCSSGLPLFRHDSDVRSLEKKRESQRGRFGKSRKVILTAPCLWPNIIWYIGSFVERYGKADGTFVGEVTACSFLSESAGSCTVEQWYYLVRFRTLYRPAMSGKDFRKSAVSRRTSVGRIIPYLVPLVTDWIPVSRKKQFSEGVGGQFGE